MLQAELQSGEIPANGGEWDKFGCSVATNTDASIVAVGACGDAGVV
jgi:hypothetical protein